MVTLKEALKLDLDGVKSLKEEIVKDVKSSDLNAYVGNIEDFSCSDGGIPILLKDNISVKGIELTCASKMLEGYIAPYDATVVKNFKKANLAPFGRANMDEFAMGSTGKNSAYGRVKNPINKDLITGGSSSGSAAAVAGNIAVAALGTDTGGSVRQPAAFCGCVGFKPTYGTVSRYGVIAYGSSLDQVGTITQDVTDSAILFDAIKGHDERDSTSSNIDLGNTYKNLTSDKKYKIAVINGFSEKASSSVNSAFNKAKELLSASGCEFIDVDFMDVDELVQAYYILVSAEAATNLGRYDGIRYGHLKEGKDLNDTYIKTRSEGFGDTVQKKILLGNSVLSSGFYDSYYKKALAVRSKVISVYDEIFAKADIILSPVNPDVAFSADKELDSISEFLTDIYTVSVNLAYLPAISLPVQKDSSGLNVSVQLIANKFKDQDLLNCAYKLESLIKG